MIETERIKQVYAQRQREGLEARYTPFNDASLYMIQARERELMRALKREHFISLAETKILDVGCGDGGELRRFLAYGANPDNLYGIDLLGERVAVARKANPRMHIFLGNVETLPFSSKCFDLVMQFTVFSSVLDRSVKQRIASEMIRVVKPDGMIVWYDFWVSNPRNPNVRGIRRDEIEALFPNCQFRFHRVTLAPPLTRALIQRSWPACYLLEKIPLICTHYLTVIRMNNEPF